MIKNLKQIAKEVRKDILITTTKAGSGHPSSALSAVEIIVTLYFYKMRHKPKNPKWPDRDRFILSKGHAVPALYSVLARSGYFDIKELMSLRKLNSKLQGHPDMKSCPGIEMSTGALGQGLSVANGIALAGKLDKKDYRVYCLIGDGEVQEGQIWEAAMSASHYKLDNLTVILDFNKLQIDGFVNKIKNIEPIKDKFIAFGFEVMEIDGHNFNEIINALNKAEKIKGKPTVIIAHTIKGKGVPFMENKEGWHGKPLSEEQLKIALKELK